MRDAVLLFTLIGGMIESLAVLAGPGLTPGSGQPVANLFGAPTGVAFAIALVATVFSMILGVVVMANRSGRVAGMLLVATAVVGSLMASDGIYLLGAVFTLLAASSRCSFGRDVGPPTADALFRRRTRRRPSYATSPDAPPRVPYPLPPQPFVEIEPPIGPRHGGTRSRPDDAPGGVAITRPAPPGRISPTRTGAAGVDRQKLLVRMPMVVRAPGARMNRGSAADTCGSPDAPPEAESISTWPWPSRSCDSGVPRR